MKTTRQDVYSVSITTQQGQYSSVYRAIQRERGLNTSQQGSMPTRQGEQR